MKIIDWYAKGHVVRFFLGKDELKTWYGDDWDDAPFEHNAGSVYKEYISAHKDIVVNFDDVVIEPNYNTSNSPYSKEDMMKRNIPCIIVMSNKLFEDINSKHHYNASFAVFATHPETTKYFMGDKMDEQPLLTEVANK